MKDKAEGGERDREREKRMREGKRKREIERERVGWGNENERVGVNRFLSFIYKNDMSHGLPYCELPSFQNLVHHS